MVEELEGIRPVQNGYYEEHSKRQNQKDQCLHSALGSQSLDLAADLSSLADDGRKLLGELGEITAGLPLDLCQGRSEVVCDYIERAQRRQLGCKHHSERN